MQRRAKRLLSRVKDSQIARTDVVAFYENVDLDILIDDIGSLEIAGYDSRLLRTFLEGFQRNTHAWGLPQGPEASGLLSNLYLQPVDDLLIRSGAPHLRYSDDIDIFASDWSELRSILLDVNTLLRSRRLTMSSEKTQIYDHAESVQLLENSEKNAIQYRIRTRGKAAAKDVIAYFERTVGTERPTPRDLKFALYRLRQFEDQHAVGWCLDNVEHFPHLANEIFDYLYTFHELDEHISKILVNIVRKSTRIVNPALDRQILRYFLARDISNTTLKDLSWSMVDESGKSSIQREFASRYVGRNSKSGDGQRLIHRFESENDDSVRRALLIGSYEARYCPATLLNHLTRDKTDLRWTALYLSGSPRVPLPKES